MPSLRLPLKNNQPDEIFSDMPPTLRTYVRRGFEQLGELEQAKVQPLVNVLSEGHQAMDEVGVNEILRRLEYKVGDKGSFGMALGLLTIFVSGRDDVGEIIAAGEKAGVIPSTSVPRIEQIATELAKVTTLAEAVEATSLANQVAPSFQSFDFAVELRFGFEENKIARTVPVVICQLNTDSDRHHCTFQMTKSDVAQLLFELKQIESQMSAVENWNKERK